MKFQSACKDGKYAKPTRGFDVHEDVKDVRIVRPYPIEWESIPYHQDTNPDPIIVQRQRVSASTSFLLHFKSREFVGE